MVKVIVFQFHSYLENPFWKTMTLIVLLWYVNPIRWD